MHISLARLASFCHLRFISDPLIVSKFHNETHDPKGQENKIYTIVKTESSTKEINIFEGMKVSHLALESKTRFLPDPLNTFALFKGRSMLNAFKVSEYLWYTHACLLRDFKNAPFYILCLFHMIDLRMFSLSFFIFLQNGP